MTPFPADAFRFAGARLGLVEGFFYKRIAVEKKGGDGFYWMPVVVATSIVPVNTSRGESNVAAWAGWIALAGAGICAVLFVVLVLRRKKERAEAIRRHEERVSKRQAVGSGAHREDAAAAGASAGSGTDTGAGTA
jgi:hypothetical protein